MPRIGSLFMRLSRRLDPAFAPCFAIANCSAIALAAFPSALSERTALMATFGLLWTGGLIFVRCTYAPMTTARRTDHDAYASAYVRAHPWMRAIIDAHFTAYFAVLALSTVLWVYGG